jgi:3-oxoacyl-[acyl-carrier protein] reductase
MKGTPMPGTLEGKVALVTGGSRGLGAVIAAALAGEGANVAITYVSSADKAAEVVENLKSNGVRAIAIRSDLGDTSSARPVVAEVVARLGRLDIVVNNAAVVAKGQLVDDPDLDVTALDRQWQVNVMGTVAMTRAAAPVISDGGRIVYIGSLNGTHALVPGVADYSGTKAALIGYAKGVARDLGSRAITANVVQPGAMPTDMMVEVLGDTTAPDDFLDMHAIRRIATLEEVAALVSFLAGPNGGYITGGVIDVAGGLGT